jgi:hypothetical protein
MNKKIKTRWLRALRSGKYKKGVGHLNTNDQKFCCLGVLCEIAKKDGVVEKTWGLHDIMRYGGRDGVLPEEVVAWAGVEDCNPSVNGRALAEHNDGYREFGVEKRPKSFIQIAKLIEKYL